MKEIQEIAMTDYQILRLLISAITPLVVVIIAFMVNKRIKKFEHSQWRNQKLISKKLAVYEELIPKINDILCYFTYIGTWKKFTPEDIINLKRDTDKIAYVYAPLFEKNFLKEYNIFIDNCFRTYSGWGNDANLKTDIVKRKESNNDWVTSWDDLFVDKKDITDPKVIQKSYITFVKFFAQEIKMGMNSESIGIGDLPRSMRK